MIHELHDTEDKAYTAEENSNAKDDREPKDGSVSKLFVTVKFEQRLVVIVAHRPRHNQCQINNRPDTKATKCNQFQDTGANFTQVKPVDAEHTPHEAKEERD